MSIKKYSDLEKLPKNKSDPSFSFRVLVSSTKHWSLNKVFLMYFDFNDKHFHFPNYGRDWSDIKLKPVVEIDKWMPVPNKPVLKGDKT